MGFRFQNVYNLCLVTDALIQGIDYDIPRVVWLWVEVFQGRKNSQFKTPLRILGTISLQHSADKRVSEEIFVVATKLPSDHIC